MSSTRRSSSPLGDDIAARLSRVGLCEAGAFGIIPGEAAINVALFDNVGTTAFEEGFPSRASLEDRESTVPNERKISGFKWWSFPGGRSLQTFTNN